jgi:hypothetical protein
MKLAILLALSVVCLAVDMANWPDDYACASFDPTGQEVFSPTYKTPVTVVDDYLDLAVSVRGDAKIVKLWTTNTSVMEPAAYTFRADDVEASPVITDTATYLQYLYYSATTRDTLNYSCEYVDCSGNKFCVVSMHLHIGHLNHWGFSNLALVNGMWHTGAQLWFNVTREITIATLTQERVETVVFPIELYINNTFSIDVETPLTVYGTQNLAVTLLLFREYPYQQLGEKALDLKFATSVQYPFEVKSIRMLNPNNTLTGAIDAPKNEGEWLLDNSNLIFEQTANNTPKYIYQFVTTTTTDHYINFGNCPEGGDCRWNGDYEIRITLQCRSGTGGWCSLSGTDPWWEEQSFTFRITSNNICPQILYKDPVNGHVLYKLVAGQSPVDNGANKPSSFSTEYKYVADDYVYFLFRGDKDGSQATQTLRLKSAELNSFTFTKLVTPNVPYYIFTKPSSWLANIDAPVSVGVECQGIEVLPGALPDQKCFTQADTNGITFYYPALSFGFKLDATTFGLERLINPVTFTATGSVTFTYDFYNPTSKKNLFASSGDFNMVFKAATGVGPAPAPQAAIPAGSNTGAVIGGAIGAVAVVAAGIAFLVVRQKRKGEGMTKLKETSA